MTKREKKIISQVIDDLMDNDGDFSGAIAKLCRLVGNVYPAGEIGQCKKISLEELDKLHPGDIQFKAPSEPE